MNHERDNIPGNERVWEDICGLLRNTQGLSNYHELRHCDDIQEILQRWPLLDLKTEQQTRSANLPATHKRPVNVTLVTGTASGVGTTTVVANLARALQQQGRKVMVADLSCRQDLHFHLGGASAVPANDSDAGHRISLLSDPEDAGDVQDVPPAASPWLADRLSTLPINVVDHLLIDCPWHAQVAFQQACALAGRILLVTTAEQPITFHQIDLALAHVTSASQPDTINTHLLINRFNFAVPLQRDIHTLLHSRPPIALAPAEIPHESRIADSLARPRDIVSLVPGCAATHRFHLLGNWLIDQATQQEKTV
ncbi:hypothetical protein MNBD_GAMMA20-518 [hydrothermal vent metagenome]|uniref:CobQ/CobB/MinD/ParA nucleotide binding domain-containing protein n=1 Tax=hydrothermal vent metagenome TaxID=652676 RepID=A0A3B1AF37_9ZZZZ